MKTRTFVYSLLTPALVTALAAAPAAAQPPTTTKPASPSPTVQQERERRDPDRNQSDSRSPVKDSWITMKVHAQFIPEDALGDSDIDVDTRNGVVTLTGTVVTPAGRDRAVAIARATDGVKSVNDKLRIGISDDDRDTSARVGTTGREAARETKDTARSATGAVSDGWIKSKIYSQYLTDDALDDSDINLDVERGVVTLKGTVVSAAGQSRAEQIAKATDGVKSVRNNLRVAKGR